MGMAASQVRLLQLTSRKNTIGRELTMLSMDKMALTRDMNKVSTEYQEALSSKVLKWSNNGGVSYINLTYDNLMKPSAMNQNVPYLLTNTNGKVVIDSDYEKYAKMISPDGSAGGDWESVKTKVISELTGIDPNKLESLNDVRQSVYESNAQLANLKAKEPQKLESWTTPDKLLENMGDVNPGADKGSTWSEAYRKSGSIALGTASQAMSNLDSIGNSLKSGLGKYFVDYQEHFTSAVDEKVNEYKQFLESGHISGAISGDTNNVALNVRSFIDEVMGAYSDKNGNVQDSNGAWNGNGVQSKYLWYNIDDEKYQKREEEREQWQQEYDKAVNENKGLNQTDNQLFTAEEESLINYYDAIFSSIAEKGWTKNNQVEDTDYLNQMLQNNMYTLTSVQRNVDYNPKSGQIEWTNQYSSDIASNCKNVYSVNDNTALYEAQSEYEAKKQRINQKEQRIDTRMQNLQTEQSAINQMIQGIEAVRNKNIETNFAIFG